MFVLCSGLSVACDVQRGVLWFLVCDWKVPEQVCHIKIDNSSHFGFQIMAEAPAALSAKPALPVKDETSLESFAHCVVPGVITSR